MSREVEYASDRAVEWLERMARDGRPCLKEQINYSRLFDTSVCFVVNNEQERVLIGAPEVSQAGPSIPPVDPLSKVPRRERPSDSMSRTITRSYQDTAHPRCSTEGAATLKEIFIFLSGHAVDYHTSGRHERFRKLDQLIVKFVEYILYFAELLQQIVPEIKTGTTWSKERQLTGKLPSMDHAKQLVLNISPVISSININVAIPATKVGRELGFESHDHETCGTHAKRIGLGASARSEVGTEACAYLSGGALVLAAVAAGGSLVHASALGVITAIPAAISSATTYYGWRDQDNTSSISDSKDVLEREQKAGGFVNAFNSLTGRLGYKFDDLQDINRVTAPEEIGKAIDTLLSAFDVLKDELDVMLPVMIHWGVARDVA
ncbi:hypothetical protein FRB94_010071 [Tulasnella sp. JGI-2019a]|nr:hypothetical protein FRB94_010071 [Tulasnella sp. JGI-2019a]